MHFALSNGSADMFGPAMLKGQWTREISTAEKSEKADGKDPRAYQLFVLQEVRGVGMGEDQVRRRRRRRQAGAFVTPVQDFKIPCPFALIMPTSRGVSAGHWYMGLKWVF